MQWHQYLTIVLGALAIWNSVRAAIFFWKVRTHLSEILSWNFAAEALMTFMTFSFAVAAGLGYREEWSEGFQSSLRIIALTCVCITTARVLNHAKYEYEH